MTSWHHHPHDLMIPVVPIILPASHPRSVTDESSWVVNSQHQLWRSKRWIFWQNNVRKIGIFTRIELGKWEIWQFRIRQELELTNFDIFLAIFCSKSLFSIHNHSILQKNINRWTFLLTLPRVQHSVCVASFKKGKQLSSNYQYFNVYFPRVSSFPPQCAQFSSCFSTLFLLSQRELLREGSNLRLTTFVPALISIVNFTLEWTHWASGDREHRGNIQETSPAPDPPSPPPRGEAKSW